MAAATSPAIINPYITVSGYVYLNVPIRFVRQLGITSGRYLIAYVQGNKLVLSVEDITLITEREA